MKKIFTLCTFITVFSVFASLSNLSAQSTISYHGNRNYILRERTNLRRYDNGKYIGLVSREISSFIIPYFDGDDYIYEGSFYLIQDTLRNNFAVENGINDSIPSVFKISDTGTVTMLQDNGYPTFRSFPTYTNNQIQIGDKWNAKAERAVDPLNKGVITKMPIYVQYTYAGDDNFNGEPVYLLTAQWATRYGSGLGTVIMDWGGDKNLTQAFGTHNARIFVSKKTGNALVIHDTVDETFVYSDGNKYTFKGQISQFTEYPPAIDRSKILQSLKRYALISEENAAVVGKALEEENQTRGTDLIASTTPAKGTYPISNIKTTTGTDPNSYKNVSGGTDPVSTISSLFSTRGTDPDSSTSPAPLVTVDKTDAGLRLTIPNLQFQPNSSELVAGEKDRLDKIALVLKEAGNAKLLIEGHTARIGSQDDELQLSENRANTIASELKKRGINAENIICKGSGGSKPIADNSTPEGREKNRRVEITILD